MSDYTPTTRVHRDNYHITVEAVEDRWIRHTTDPHRKKLAQLEEIKREIARHVDDIEGIAVCYDSHTVCAYCECRWDWSVDDDGIPGCCDQAVSDYESQTGEKVS